MAIVFLHRIVHRCNRPFAIATTIVATQFYRCGSLNVFATLAMPWQYVNVFFATIAMSW
jgi:hypothetical protein